MSVLVCRTSGARGRCSGCNIGWITGGGCAWRGNTIDPKEWEAYMWPTKRSQFWSWSGGALWALLFSFVDLDQQPGAVALQRIRKLGDVFGHGIVLHQELAQLAALSDEHADGFIDLAGAEVHGSHQVFLAGGHVDGLGLAI